MTGEFDHVRASFASSLPGRFLRHIARVAGSAWQTSVINKTWQSVSTEVSTLPRATVVRSVALAVAIAASLQPLLIWMMPATVVPAMPKIVFVAAAVLAVVVALRSEDVARAWPGSRVARWLR